MLFVAGCVSVGADGDGSPSGNAGDGGAVPAATIDGPVLLASGGTLANPYVLPAELPAGTSGDIADYLAQGGYWMFTHAGVNLGLQGKGKDSLGRLIYHTGAADEWHPEINGVPYVLNSAGDGTYVSEGCSAPKAVCVRFTPYQDPARSLYGIFALTHYDDRRKRKGKAGVTVSHMGLKTPVADMPGGSGRHTGAFAGIANDGANVYAAAGTTTIMAEFGTGIDTGTLSLVSEGKVGTHGTYRVEGRAAIVGNAYQGSATAMVTLSDTHAADSSYAGGIDGAFYGPGAMQTAGVIATTSTANGNVFAGGYWATSFHSAPPRREGPAAIPVPDGIRSRSPAASP